MGNVEKIFEDNCEQRKATSRIRKQTFEVGF